MWYCCVALSFNKPKSGVNCGIAIILMCDLSCKSRLHLDGDQV